jgi:hypothetical protein
MSLSEKSLAYCPNPSFSSHVAIRSTGRPRDYLRDALAHIICLDNGGVQGSGLLKGFANTAEFNEFLPISIPDHGNRAVEVLGHGVLLCLWSPLPDSSRWRGRSTAGPSH